MLFSEKLKLRDTTLIIVGYLPAIPGFFGEAFFSEVTSSAALDSV